MRSRLAARLAAILLLALVVAAPRSTLHRSGPGGAEAEPEVDWMEMARAAWNYFQPGIGVSRLGLNYATPSWHYATDWDLGCYISAIIDAEILGLVPRDGLWGADDRIKRVLNFLASRPLHPSGVPYGVYNSDTGEPGTSGPSNPSDAGRLLVALYRLKQHRPDLSSYIEAVVERNGFLKFASSVPNSGFYSYYYAHGYYLWGARTMQVVEAVSMLATLRSKPTIDAYGVKLPYVEITMEPILHAVFELNPPEEFFHWADLVLQAQVNRYKATGKPTAFTEGGHTSPPHYIYEWIVDIYTGRTFTVWNPSFSTLSLTPVVYSKAAIGMHAIWGNNYTRMLVDYVMKAMTPNGFYEGVDENGRVIYQLTDKTNALIVNAARYALLKAKPPVVSEPGLIEVYPGDSATVSILVNHSLSLPATVSASASSPELRVSVEPAAGRTPLNTTLSVEVSGGARPGAYTVTLEVRLASLQVVSRNLTVLVKPPGYTLRVRALDACGEPAANVTVRLGDLVVTTSSDGVAVFRRVNGTYTLTATLGGVPVMDPQTVVVAGDSEVVLKLRIYKVLIEARNYRGEPAGGVLLKAYASGFLLSTARTNSSGKAVLAGIPPGNITVRAFTGDGRVELGSWTLTVRGDVDVVDPEIVLPSLEGEDAP